MQSLVNVTNPRGMSVVFCTVPLVFFFNTDKLIYFSFTGSDFLRAIRIV